MSLALLLSAMLLASGQPAQAERRPIDVRSDVDDALTQKFTDALSAALPESQHLRLSSGDDPDGLTLVVLFKVEVDGKRFSYAADLLKATGDPTPERLDSLTGTCNVNAIDACALGVVKKVDRKAKD